MRLRSRDSRPPRVRLRLPAAGIAAAIRSEGSCGWPARGGRRAVHAVGRDSDPAWPALAAASITVIEGRRDLCIILWDLAAYVREGDDTGGAQCLAVMAVDLSRWRKRALVCHSRQCGWLRRAPAAPAASERGGRLSLAGDVAPVAEARAWVGLGQGSSRGGGDRHGPSESRAGPGPGQLAAAPSPVRPQAGARKVGSVVVPSSRAAASTYSCRQRRGSRRVRVRPPESRAGAGRGPEPSAGRRPRRPARADRGRVPGLAGPAGTRLSEPWRSPA